MIFGSLRIVYIDPGVEYVGWAVFGSKNELEAVGMCSRKDFKEEVAGRTSFCVIEKPWGVGGHTTEQDIMNLCLAAGEYGGRFANTRYETPPSTPKPIRHAQARKRLKPHELALLPKQKTQLKHIMCAVWMGLRDRGRMV